MFNRIDKTVRRFRKEIKGDIDVLSIVGYVPKIDYRVVFFNTPAGDKLISLYGLEEKAKSAPAFTISRRDNVIFVDNDINSQEKLYNLLHEVGHIMLGHLGDGKAALRDKTYLEIEANTFVYEVMNPHKRNIALQLAILFTVVALGFVGGFIARRIIPDNAATDTVIITQNGESYHREGCMAIKGKDFISIPRSQAKKIFDPCGICNP